MSTIEPGFDAVRTCWICGGTALRPVHQLTFDLSEYRTQDPELAAYTGRRLDLCRCGACGFAQPAALPSLPRYFDRMYDQRWSDEWVRSEFDSTVKDAIFDDVLRGLAARIAGNRRRLLDIGAHAGRFIARAHAAGWAAEGLELNPRTAAFAAERTGLRVRQLNISDVDAQASGYDAITLTDVLEHIPQPIDVLARAASLLAPGGCIAVKVPCGPSQLTKETWRARLRPRYRPTIADNLVHIGHFSPRSLALALARAGFTDITVEPGVPELPPSSGVAGWVSRSLRRSLHLAARLLPAGVDTPLTLNLQAYGRRP
jgi:SAM-dependent methyltransferase